MWSRSHRSKSIGPSEDVADCKEHIANAQPESSGLHVVFTPSKAPSVDIIFVHGLGGSSEKSWCYDGDPERFWPKVWLPLEPETCTARVMTFGYNAYYKSTGPNNISGISDFARNLLFSMKFGRDLEDRNDLDIGKVAHQEQTLDIIRLSLIQRPIIFVVHSMGGLVFKTAYVQGHNSDEYKQIISQIRAVLFLSTPHRGAVLADYLNRLLSMSPLHGSKAFIAELSRKSPSISELNESFRNLAGHLQSISSLYETLETSVAGKHTMIVGRDSSSLGYPGELIQPLNADHNNVCKFPSRENSNYQVVSSILHNLISRYRDNSSKVSITRSTSITPKLEVLLGVSSAPEEDYLSQLHRWKAGTCRTILNTSKFIEWERSPQSFVLWLYAQPGSGKSIQASFLINHLIGKGHRCQYFFFQHGNSSKQSAGDFLKSLAFQIAQDVQDFHDMLTTMSDKGVRLDKMDSWSIWQKLFVSMLFDLQSNSPLYWVIDALDESDSQLAIIEHFKDLVSSKVVIHVLITSRQIPTIKVAFDRIAAGIPVLSLSLDNNKDDIRHYATSEKEFMRGSPQFRQQIVDRLVDQAGGSFLWVHLVLKEISQCHSEIDIQKVLKEVPSGMEDLYGRMAKTINNLKRPSDVSLARSILAWATYSRRSLHTEELLEALKPEHPRILDLEDTINQVCGQFVKLDKRDNRNYVSLVHYTAREYLVKTSSISFFLEPEAAHEKIFKKTLSIFIHRNLRTRLSEEPWPPLYAYSASSWGFHLSRSSEESEQALEMLTKFFSGGFVLPWIQAVAMIGELKSLVYTSQSIAAFARQYQSFYARRLSLNCHLADFEVLELWAIDLLKIVGKFGGHLLQDPTAIYKYIPQFCPQNSKIYQQFGHAHSSPLRVEGLSNADWDDCLARLSVGAKNEALLIRCFGRFLAILTSKGNTILWDSCSFEEIRTFIHEEHVHNICFSNKGEMLASYGSRSTRIWKTSDGQLLHDTASPLNARPLDLRFLISDSILIAALDTRKVTRLDLADVAQGWQFSTSAIFQEDSTIPGTNPNSPNDMAFSPDMTQVAVAYRGYPLSVWTLKSPKLVSRCKRRMESSRLSRNLWTGVSIVRWHPRNGYVLGIYTDGAVFKWHPLEKTHQELKVDTSEATPSELDISPNGSVFVTSDVDGTIKLYSFHHFILIYQLSSEDVVTAICFSPDGRRFYDIRGSYCNVWEPNSLIRISDTDEQGLETDTWAESMKSVSFDTSEAHVESLVPITALSARRQGDLLCIGNAKGTVELENVATAEKVLGATCQAEMAVEHLIWAEDGIHFAFVDLGGRVVVKAAKEKKPNGWEIRSVMNESFNIPKGGAHRLLVSPDSNYVLVASPESAQLWSIQRLSVCGSYISSSPGPVAWTNHPLEPKLLLVFSPSTVTAFTWSRLGRVCQWQIEPSPYASPSDTDDDSPDLQRLAFEHLNLDAHESVDKLIVSDSKEFILLFISRSEQHRRHRNRLHILKASSLATPSDTEGELLKSITIPTDIASSIERPLEVLSNGRLVFLDESFWVCSWRIQNPGGPSALLRHFFLPRDWVNAESLSLCQVIDNGTFLCPRKGEVAIIHSDLGSDW